MKNTTPSQKTAIFINALLGENPSIYIFISIKEKDKIVSTKRLDIAKSFSQVEDLLNKEKIDQERVAKAMNLLSRKYKKSIFQFCEEI